MMTSALGLVGLSCDFRKVVSFRVFGVSFGVGFRWLSFGTEGFSFGSGPGQFRIGPRSVSGPEHARS